LTDQVEPAGAGETIESRHHGARRVIAVAMIVVLVLVLIVVVVQVAKDGSSGLPEGQPISGTGTTPVQGLNATVGAATAWTGTDLFVFGGTDRTRVGPGKVSNSGARIDVMSGDSTAVPDAPFDAPLISPVAARAGDAIVVMGVECPAYNEPDDSPSPTCEADGAGFAVAAYDLGAGTWTDITPPPHLDSVADGRPVDPASGNPFVSWTPQLVGVTERGSVIVSLDRTGGDVPDFWALEPTTGEWRHLGSPGRAFARCVAGEQLVVSTAARRDQNTDWVDVTLRSLDTDAPEAGWKTSTTIPGARYPSFGGPRITCMGTRVMVTGSLGEANGGYRVFDSVTQTLSTPPAPPAGDGGAIGARIWNGTELLFLNFSPRISGSTVDHSGALLPGHSYDPAANTWRTIPGFPVLPMQPIRAGSAVVDLTMPAQPLPLVQSSTDPDVPADTGNARKPSAPVVVHYSPY
jgi:hypothetical protein